MGDRAGLLKARLRQNLKEAMQARRGQEVRLLRAIVAAVDNAEAVQADAGSQTFSKDFADGTAEVPRRKLSAADLRKLLEAEIEARLTAALDYERLGRLDEHRRLSEEADYVRRYLAP